MAEPYAQKPQMEDPTMVGTLAAQAEMIWPLEKPLLEALDLGGRTRLADLGCGTGEFAGRVARQWPGLQVDGVDLFPGHLERARTNWPARTHPNLRFHEADARQTPFAPASFGAVTIRHLLQALEDPAEVLKEAHRLLRPGGLLYVLAEDYQMLLADIDDSAAERLFLDAAGPVKAGGSNLFSGRVMFREMKRLGFRDVRVRPIVVDTESASRETFATMLGFWRDGFAGFLARWLGCTESEIRRRFQAWIDAVASPDRYACWLLFAVSGVR